MSDASPPSPREYLAGLMSLVPRAVRALWIGGIVFAAAVGGTVALTLSTAHLYRSEAVIGYDHGVRTATLGSGTGDSPREISGRLRDMFMSRQRLERVIKEMNLYRVIADHHGIGEAIDEMRRHLTVSGHDEYTFRVAYDAGGRELAQRVLEGLVKGVLDEDAQRRLHEAEDSKRFLDVERKHADDDLHVREGALAVFLTDHPELAGETGGGAATTGGMIRAKERDRAPAASGEIATLELQAAQLEEQLAAAGVRVTTPGVAPAGDPALITAAAHAQAEQQAAQKDLADKQARYTNEHPDVKAALRRAAVTEAAFKRAQAALEADRAAAAAAVKHSTPPPPTTADDDGQPSTRTAALKHALAAVRSQIAAVKSRGVSRIEVPQGSSAVVKIDTEFTRLNREVSEARERQMVLEGKQFQAELMATLAGGGQGGRLIVLDPPFRPVRPITGGRFKIAAVGLAVSMMLAILTVLLFAAFDDRLYGEADLRRIIKDGIVVAIPKLTGKSG